MRGKIDVVNEKRPEQIPSVVKSVKQINRLVHASAAPKIFKPTPDYQKTINFEHHYGINKRLSTSPNFSQGAIQTSSEKGELSKRLIKVLAEEENLSKHSSNKLPVIK